MKGTTLNLLAKPSELSLKVTILFIPTKTVAKGSKSNSFSNLYSALIPSPEIIVFNKPVSTSLLLYISSAITTVLPYKLAKENFSLVIFLNLILVALSPASSLIILK